MVGTTGWYQHLEDMRSLAARKDAGLLYSTNFSFGIQLLYQMAKLLGKSGRRLSRSRSTKPTTRKNWIPLPVPL